MNNQITKHGKKIIHVVQHLAPGGLETLTLDLLRLAKPTDQVLIVSLRRHESRIHRKLAEAEALPQPNRVFR